MSLGTLLLRSDEMGLYKVLIQKDMVYEVMSELGEYGYAQFISDKNENSEHKPYRKFNTKCESSFRKIK